MANPHRNPLVTDARPKHSVVRTLKQKNDNNYSYPQNPSASITMIVPEPCY